MTAGICPFVENLTAEMAPHTYQRGGPAKVGFCDHAAGGFYTTLRDVGFWSGRGVSVHFSVARDGRACQLVNLFDVAYGQGILNDVSWEPYFGEMEMQNPNLYLISTEHEDAETVDGRTVFIPAAEWTAAQYATDLRIKRWAIEEAGREGMDLMRFGLDSLAGHFMFDGRNRVNCPGPAWQREYRERLFADLTGQQEEADMLMQPFFSRHPRFNGSEAVTVDTQFAVNVFSELGVPQHTKMVRLEVFKDPPNYLGIGHGEHGYAGCVMDAEKHGFCDVIPDGAGNVLLDARYGPAAIWEVRASGYWL